MMNSPPPPLPPYPTSLVSEEKWSLCSLLSLKGDIWRMGGWTDPSDENLRGPLPAGAVHCPRLPWKPLYMLNLLLFSQIWPRSDWHGRAAERKRVLPALARPLSGCSCCNVAKKTSPKIKSFFFFFPDAKWCLRSCVFVVYWGKTGPEAELRYIPFVVCLKPFQVRAVLPAASWVNIVQNQYLYKVLKWRQRARVEQKKIPRN